MNERDKRRYMATIASWIGIHGVSLACEAYGENQDWAGSAHFHQ